MNLNVLVRGQSNAILMMEGNGGAGAAALQKEIERLLGFDGVNDKVSLVFGSSDLNASTAFGGTSLVNEWLVPRNGDWHQGWTIGSYEQALLNEIAGIPAAQKGDPTAVLWLHSESDSSNPELTVEQWMSALRYDAALVRAALGQDASTVPYMFVSAMPYAPWGTDGGHQAIRQGMERLAAEVGFNAQIATRMQDIDASADDMDGNPATPDYGGGHIDAGDIMQTVQRSARAIAEAFSAYARPGSAVAAAGGNIADEGPMVFRAMPVGTNQLRIDVVHDNATGFQALDADAARGLGWSVQGSDGTVWGTAAQIVDGDTLLLTFSGPLPADGKLFYGYGYGRLAGSDGSGRGNAVYDNQGLPVWVPAEGVQVGLWTAAPLPGVTLNGTAANDVLRGTARPDSIFGADGNDDIGGGGGNDTLSGGNGHDTVTGGAGDDWLIGGTGNDVLRGNAGNDVVTTGAGVDRVIFGTGDGADRVTDFTLGTDRVQLAGTTADQVTARVTTVNGVSGLLLTLSSGDTLFLEGVGAATAQQLGIPGSFASGNSPQLPPTTNTVNGTAGNDALVGGAGADRMLGGAGSDDLQGLEGNDVLRGGRDHDGLTGGAGADTFVFTLGDGPDWVVDFQLGTDKLWFEGVQPSAISQTFTSYWGMAGLQIDYGTGDFVFLQGVTTTLTAADMVFADESAPGNSPQLPSTTNTVNGTAGDDALVGTADADLMLGGAGSDDLQGLEGNDVLRGGRDHDGLTGGAGADTFVFALGDGSDWVVDFQPGTDKLWFEGVQPSAVRQSFMTYWGMAGLQIDYGTGDLVFLQGVTTNLTASDMVFA